MMTGVILAGGLNRRMGGRPKALLPVQGEAMLLRQLKEMSHSCEQIIVVTSEVEPLQPVLAGLTVDIEVLCVRDIYPQKGPLSGIHAASKVAHSTHLWIVGCDMPFISGDAAKAMVEVCRDTNVDAVIPELEGRLHPLHGIYGRDVGPEAELLLQQQNYRLMGLLDHIDWQSVNLDFFVQRGLRTNFATNLNTPEEYKDMLDNLSLE
ncbi:molybdenum cofactor guanylyltransferase [Paenibacillus qinlingensis]|uniref:Probable molybdenum cofactor guanylyltransferase n=1 Tax=Paenibacillus qinlingensis TaxID=1837343 RepID=A0ABU1P369_9BACL|nr:molybdenum cofactor guanylyltransferase [Paenibacillus qinlingensis]MDR6554191.1 molybdopterin-guanine dinucleotide biosynthesis protein A [Paenibacillus qinlingensis]